MKLKQLKVRLTLTESILGAIPKNKEVYAAYIATKAPKDENAAEEVESVEDLEENGWPAWEHL